MYNPKDLMLRTTDIAAGKLKRSIFSVFIASLLGGLFIGLGYYGYLRLSSGYITYDFFASLVFTSGLVLIIIGGGELFTGDCLFTFGLFHRRYSVWRMLFYLLIVWVGNFIGAIILALFVKIGFDVKSFMDITRVVNAKVTNLTFLKAFISGILCNILVAMAVYMSAASDSVSGKVLTTVIPISLFVICGFEHCVANMFILSYGYFEIETLTLADIFLKNLLPVTLGNIVGGGLIIPVAYYLIHKKQ